MMPKLTKKQWLLATVLLLVVSLIVYYFKSRKGKTEARVIPLIPDTLVTSEVKLFSDCPNDTFPLKYGKCGKRVEQFQIYLIRTYGAQFTQFGVDGKWGDETEAIAKRFILKNEPFTISEEYFNKTGMGTFTTIKYA